LVVANFSEVGVLANATGAVYPSLVSCSKTAPKPVADLGFSKRGFW